MIRLSLTKQQLNGIKLGFPNNWVYYTPTVYVIYRLSVYNIEDTSYEDNPLIILKVKDIKYNCS